MINKLNHPIWKKEELPQQLKKSTTGTYL